MPAELNPSSDFFPDVRRILANPPFNDSDTTLRGSAFPQREIRPLVVSEAQDNFHVGWHTGEYDSNRKRSWR